METKAYDACFVIQMLVLLTTVTLVPRRVILHGHNLVSIVPLWNPPTVGIVRVVNVLEMVISLTVCVVDIVVCFVTI